MEFIFTNDDAGASDDPRHIEWFNQVVDWLDKMGIPGTFFWVPAGGGRPGDQKKEWMEAISRARKRGHDFQLHGYRHDTCLEFGVPSESTRITNPMAFEEYERNKEKWIVEHSVEKLGEKIRDGIEIYRRAFGEKPLVFRSPCFGMCDAAYEALWQSGIFYSSSRSVNPVATAYVATKRKELRIWRPDFPSKPWREKSGVLEIPCMEDLAIFGVKEKEYKDYLDLYKTEFSNYMKELGDWKFGVFGSHYHSMLSTWETTSRLYEEFFDWLHSAGVSNWTTFRKVLR